jgi:hypothetical protein
VSIEDIQATLPSGNIEKKEEYKWK